MMETTPPGHPETSEPATVPDYIAWKEQSRSFENLGAGDQDGRDLGVAENGMAAERIEGEGFSPEVFQILGVRPLLGRTFTAGRRSSGRARASPADQPSAMAAALRQRP